MVHVRFITVSFCLISVGFMSFCAVSPALAQLEDALGTTEAAQDEPATQPALDTDERARLDARIESELRRVFDQVDELNEIEVRVSGGVVHLEGMVPSTDVRNRARELVSQFDGVLYIDDDAEVETQLSQRVAPALERSRGYVRSFVQRLPLFGFAIAIIVLAWMLGQLLRKWEAPFRLFSRHRLVRGVARQLIGSLVLLGGIFLALELLDATAVIGAVLGAAGLLGLTLGLAFRDIAENYLASILLGLRRPFAVSDYVSIDDQYEGVVLSLTMRDTVLITLDGNHIRVPNSRVYKSVIINFTRNPKRRFSFVVGVGNAEDLVRAQAIGLRALRDLPSILSEPAPSALVEHLGDSAVQVRFLGWMNQHHHDWFRTKSEATRRVKVALEDAGVDLPVPIQRVELAPAPGAPLLSAFSSDPQASSEGKRATISGRHPDASTSSEASKPDADFEPSSEERAELTSVEPDRSLQGQIRQEQALERGENIIE